MASAAGEVFGFGDAHSFGNARTAGAHAVDIERTPDGDGYWVLDSAGRLQIPRDYMERLGLKGRVVVEMDGDQIVVRKAEN